MARPAEYGPRTTTAIRFVPDLMERLHKEAARRDVSVNTLVTWAVERALQQWETQDLDALLSAQAVIRGEGRSLADLAYEKQVADAGGTGRDDE